MEANGNPVIGKEILTEIKVSDDSDFSFSNGDVLIEFTAPQATLAHRAQMEKVKKAMVIGTTGFSSAQIEQIKKAAKTIPIVLSPNMSIGVNILFGIVGEVARQLGNGYDIEIIEAHHHHKKDAPSGTAKKLAEEVASVVCKKTEEIPTHAIRAGDIVGDHTIIYAGAGERIELTHRAQSRDPFALGALRAAKFIVGQPPGLYNMQDVLRKR